MGSDMVVALKEASAHQTTLVGVNHHGTPSQHHALLMTRGQHHDAGEIIHLSVRQIPQARKTFSVLGLQPTGQWGVVHGINDQRVAVGVTDWQSRLRDDSVAIAGIDLVRLTLERSHSARHAVDTLTDLLEHHSRTPAEASTAIPGDHIFLIADGQEAYVLEVCGKHWALLECGHTRVITDVAMIRQDWRRLAPGLADWVIQKGWGSDDGSKIDFVGSVGAPCDRSRNAQKRWGRASLTLAQQHGAIDAHFLRRMLAEHYSANRDLLFGPKPMTLANSFVVDLHKEPQPLQAWMAFGSPRVAVHFPIVLAGELPQVFQGETPLIGQCVLELEKLALGKDSESVEAAIDRMQMHFDQDADDFSAKAHHLAQSGQSAAVSALATEMMRHHADLFVREHRRLLGYEEKVTPPVPHEAEELFFA